MINPQLRQKADFIREEEIHALLRQGKEFGNNAVRDIINKAREAKGLTLEEVSALLQVTDESLVQEMLAAARK